MYECYDDENTDSGEGSLQTIVMPGSTIEAPVRGIIKDNANNPLRQLDGSVVDFTNELGDASSTMDTLKSDAGDNSASGELANTTDPVVFELDNGHEKYRVGDMLRCDQEDFFCETNEVREALEPRSGECRRHELNYNYNLIL